MWKPLEHDGMLRNVYLGIYLLVQLIILQQARIPRNLVKVQQNSPFVLQGDGSHYFVLVHKPEYQEKAHADYC